MRRKKAAIVVIRKENYFILCACGHKYRNNVVLASHQSQYDVSATSCVCWARSHWLARSKVPVTIQ